jgi:hypothetical protein
MAKLVGWQSRNPGVQFNFGAMATISSVTVWAADSDGQAGVALPTLINVRTLSGSFSQDFSITNPVGNGNTVPIELSGFSVTTDALIISATRDPLNNNWTMFSEVEFVSAIPEPTAPAFLVELAGLALLRRRRN